MNVLIGPYPDGDEKREVHITVHDYDVWSADHTLALIILPILKKYRENITGIPAILIDDGYSGEGDNFDVYLKKWENIVDRMIVAFEFIVTDELHEDVGRQREVDEDIAEGLELFGKYYRSLWN